MTNDIRSMLAELDRFDQTSESVGLELRLSLAETILRHLKAKGWTQARLARKAGVKEPFISRVLHSNANCTLDTAAKLLFALGVRACFEEAAPKGPTEAATGSTLLLSDYVSQGDTYGAKADKRQATGKAFHKEAESRQELRWIMEG